MDNEESIVRVGVESSVYKRIHYALTDARENAMELLSDHELRLGRTTKKNIQIAEMYDKEIEEIEDLLNTLTLG